MIGFIKRFFVKEQKLIKPKVASSRYSFEKLRVALKAMHSPGLLFLVVLFLVLSLVRWWLFKSKRKEEYLYLHKNEKKSADKLPSNETPETRPVTPDANSPAIPVECQNHPIDLNEDRALQDMPLQGPSSEEESLDQFLEWNSLTFVDPEENFTIEKSQNQPSSCPPPEALVKNNSLNETSFKSNGGPPLKNSFKKGAPANDSSVSRRAACATTIELTASKKETILKTPTRTPKTTHTLNPKTTPTLNPKTTPTLNPKTTPTLIPKTTPTLIPKTTPTLNPKTTPILNPKTTPTLIPKTTPTLDPKTTPKLNPNTTPKLNPNTTPKLNPNTTPKLNPNTTPKLNPNTTPKLNPNTTPKLNPNTTPKLNPNTTPKLNPNTTPKLNPNTTPKLNPNTTPKLNPNTTPKLNPNTTPILNPNTTPTLNPKTTPTLNPKTTPTLNPKTTPILNPNTTPTLNPKTTPTLNPKTTPTLNPKTTPTLNPKTTPTLNPKTTPTLNPKTTPTLNPKTTPTLNPKTTPTLNPKTTPTQNTTRTLTTKKKLPEAWKKASVDLKKSNATSGAPKMVLKQIAKRSGGSEGPPILESESVTKSGITKAKELVKEGKGSKYEKADECLTVEHSVVITHTNSRAEPKIESKVGTGTSSDAGKKFGDETGSPNLSAENQAKRSYVINKEMNAILSYDTHHLERALPVGIRTCYDTTATGEKPLSGSLKKDKTDSLMWNEKSSSSPDTMDQSEECFETVITQTNHRGGYLQLNVQYATELDSTTSDYDGSVLLQTSRRLTAELFRVENSQTHRVCNANAIEHTVMASDMSNFLEELIENLLDSDDSDESVNESPNPLCQIPMPVRNLVSKVEDEVISEILSLEDHTPQTRICDHKEGLLDVPAQHDNVALKKKLKPKRLTNLIEN